MSPLEAVVLIAVIGLPFHFLVLHQIERQEDPRILRRQGIVVVHERALEAHTEAIGHYLGHPIWGTVTFKTIHYRFSRVTPPKNKEKLTGGELYLDPGIVYVVV